MPVEQCRECSGSLVTFCRRLCIANGHTMDGGVLGNGQAPEHTPALMVILGALKKASDGLRLPCKGSMV